MLLTTAHSKLTDRSCYMNRGRQAVVFEERPPTKSGQVGGADHRHNQPAASRHRIFIVRDSRWS